MSDATESFNLEEYLVQKFREWQPKGPAVVERTKRSVTLEWMEEEPFGFMMEHLLYKVQRKEKIPLWVTVYSGGKTTKTIENLAPSHPHKFRLQVIIKSTAVSLLAEEALKHFGNKNAMYDIFEDIGTDDAKKSKKVISDHFDKCSKDVSSTLTKKSVSGETAAASDDVTIYKANEDVSTSSSENIQIDTPCEQLNNFIPDALRENSQRINKRTKSLSSSHKCLESRWSEETWTSTDTDGTSAMCFCMAVRCGYLKQVQLMVNERPMLIGAINSNYGLTPLATAIRKGDLNTVKYVLSLGAEVDQMTTAGQTPLHLAVLMGHTEIADLLLEKGANFQAEGLNGLHAEHYAVDSSDVEVVKHVMEKGGRVDVKDSNGWTPLFRAVCQGAKTDMIEELLRRGSSVDVTDRRGLTLVAAARLLRNRQGKARDSVLRLVDAQFPHEKALANFTRLTKKIYSVHTLLK